MPRKVQIAILVLLSALIGLGGANLWFLTHNDNMPPAAFHSPDVEKAVSYLCDSYNPELGLVYESPDALSMMVGAYYYGWWGKGDHWGKGYTDYPALGEYNCRDEAVINQHINRAEQAGIDFFAMSWWGPGSREDITLKSYYLPASVSSEVKFCIHYESWGCLLREDETLPIVFAESYNESQTRGDKFISDFNYLADTYFGNDQYLKINGRPVVILYIARDYQNAGDYFAQLKSEMNAKGYDPYLIADVVYWDDAGARDWDFLSQYFDAITGYNMHNNDQLENFLPNLATKYTEYQDCPKNRGLAFIPGVMPGYDDTCLEDRDNTPISRDSGQFYRDFWQVALGFHQTNPMVMITSFNEWHEGTEIEPSIEYGEKYLEITKTQNRPYWLVSDNLWAMYALEETHPEIADQIRSRLIALADEYGLPQNSEGLPISYAHEAVIGESIPIPFGGVKEYSLESTMKTVIYDGKTLAGWKQYADLLCYAALSEYNEGECEKAEKLFEIAKGMWDGKGLADGAFSTHYETYKLGLLLYTSKVLECPLEFEEELLNRLWLQQAENGGFITGYLPNGAPIGNTNSETTAIVLISLESLE